MNILFIAGLFLSSFAMLITAAQITPLYQPRLKVSLARYQKAPYLMNHMENCILRDGDCDSVGRWLKARIIQRFTTGKCELCTSQQAQELDKVVEYIKNERKDLHGLAMQKYMEQTSQSGSVDLNMFQGLFSNFRNRK